jgi:hypothetical protein
MRITPAACIKILIYMDFIPTVRAPILALAANPQRFGNVAWGTPVS